MAGHKLENIQANPRVCYNAVVGEHQVLPAKMSAYYRSAVAFGSRPDSDRGSGKAARDCVF
jgi:nitroimidazol reductase NimA-like FMN-containing flavoprotein (pyridoxamine 5'-phosphate oxidase superfamily)